jgi:hypothetical protein
MGASTLALAFSYSQHPREPSMLSRKLMIIPNAAADISYSCVLLDS